MLEHYIFIYQANCDFFETLSHEYFVRCSRTVIEVPHEDGGHKQQVRKIMSFSARSLLDLLEVYKDNSYVRKGLIELCEQVVADYDCDELFGNRFKKVIRNDWVKIDDVKMLTPEEQWEHGWKSIKFICDRGVSHEIVRHRDASFAQESTRYCNYSKDKFGNEITVIDPLMFSPDNEEGSAERQKWLFWKEGIEASERAYFYLLDMGATAQEARSVLPNSLKTEIIMTARNYEWGHFFELRCDKTAHPQMRELAIPLFEYFSENDSVLFNRDVIKFND
jgi:thymidylate synthase (FAD)